VSSVTSPRSWVRFAIRSVPQVIVLSTVPAHYVAESRLHFSRIFLHIPVLHKVSAQRTYKSPTFMRWKKTNWLWNRLKCSVNRVTESPKMYARPVSVKLWFMWINWDRVITLRKVVLRITLYFKLLSPLRLTIVSVKNSVTLSVLACSAQHQLAIDSHILTMSGVEQC
jgi:hypothetical protein